MADRYWVGGTGVWADTAHWSATSGGASGASYPTTSDTAHFDANSTGTATGDGMSECGYLDCTGHTGTLTGIVSFYGISSLGSGGTYSGLNLAISAGSGAELTSNGKTIASLFVIGSGDAKFNDAINVSGALTISSATVLLKSGATSVVGSVVTYPATQYLQSTTAGVQATLSDASGTNTLTGITVKDIAFTGGATWTGGADSYDAGNNTGITGLAPISSGSVSVPALFLHSLA